MLKTIRRFFSTVTGSRMWLGHIVFAAAFTALSVTAQTSYNGDLIVGFTAETGNDLIYDLGDPFAVTNGMTWNLINLLSSFDLTTVKWGVVGDSTGNNTNIQWVTKLTGVPPALPNFSAWNVVDTSISSIYQLFPSAAPGQFITPVATTQNSWNEQTVNGSLTTQYKNAYLNPNTSGASTISFYKVIADGSAPQAYGDFSLSPSGIVTYSKNAVTPPPPAPKISISRSGTISSISVSTTNGAIYTLFYTNSAGLTAPVTQWSSSPTKITGNGSVQTFTDNTSDSARVYRVGAH